jgi:O-antigen ligase
MTFAMLASRARRSAVDNLPYLAPGLFLFILPFPGTVAFRLFTLSIAAITAALMWRRVAPPKIPLKLPVALWIAVSVLSLVWALEPQNSLGEIKNEIGYTMVAFLTFYALTQSDRQWRLWKWAFLISACLVTSFAVYYFIQGMSDRLVGGPGPVGWHGGPGSSSTYYILLCPLLFIALEQSLIKGSFRSVPWLLLIMMTMGAYLSYNRAFWIALAISAISFVGLRLFRRTDHGKALKLTAIFSIAALGLSAASLLTVTVLRFSTEMSLDAMQKLLSHNSRIALWEFTIKHIWTHPLIGTGFGIGSERPLLDAQHFEIPKLYHAHNLFLSYGLQMGIPGMIVLLFVFVAIAREFTSLYRSSNDTCSKLGAAGLAILAGIIAKTMTDVHFARNNSLLFWALIGMILGYGKRLLAMERSNQILQERLPGDTHRIPVDGRIG